MTPGEMSVLETREAESREKPVFEGVGTRSSNSGIDI